VLVNERVGSGWIGREGIREMGFNGEEDGPVHTSFRYAPVSGDIFRRGATRESTLARASALAVALSGAKCTPVAE
jgi:hypothetical protein